jgi:hypothetical protein
LLFRSWKTDIKKISIRKLRQFRSVIGVPPELLCYLFEKVRDCALGPQKDKAALKILEKPVLLLVGLNFLKMYPTSQQGSMFWRVSTDTYRSYVRLFMDGLEGPLRDQISLSSRFEQAPAQGYFSDIWLVIDATVCPSERPGKEPLQKLLYDGRKKRHGYKYEIAVRIRDGRICWVAGPLPASFHDISVYRIFGLWSHLREGEMLLADKGYVGEPSVRAPFKSSAGHPLSFEQIVINRVHEQGRIVVEHVFSVIKRFGILRYPYRLHSKLPHSRVFLLCARLANLLFEIEPLSTHCAWK